MQTHTHEKLPPIPRAKDEEEESVSPRGMAIHFIEESAVSPPQAMYEQDRLALFNQ